MGGGGWEGGGGGGGGGLTGRRDEPVDDHLQRYQRQAGQQNPQLLQLPEAHRGEGYPWEKGRERSPCRVM